MIRRPSVTGVDAAGLPSAFMYASICFAGASRRHASVPSARLYATVQSLPPSNAVMTTLSPATTGEESPLGAGTFHLTFLSGPNSTGGFWSSATPDPFGPRNCGHTSGLSAPTATVVSTPSATHASVLFIIVTSKVSGERRTTAVVTGPPDSYYGAANLLPPGV